MTLLSITDKRRVAIAYDGSEDARKLFDWSIKNIVQPERDHLILLSAVKRDDKAFNHEELPMLSTTTSKVEEAIEEVEKHSHGETAGDRLRAMSDSLRQHHISSEEHILWGDAKTLLPRFTKANHVGLLIVGSRGLGVVKSVFLGSVSDACLKTCLCPVLVVRHATI